MSNQEDGRSLITRYEENIDLLQEQISDIRTQLQNPNLSADQKASYVKQGHELMESVRHWQQKIADLQK